MNKCGWLSLLFVASSIVLCVAFSDYSSAASQYDNVYNTVDTLYLEVNNYGGQTCDAVNISDNWYTRALDVDSNQGGWKEKLQTAYTSGDYIVSQMTSFYGGGYYKAYLIIYSNKNGLDIFFSGNELRTASNSETEFIGSVLLRDTRAESGTGNCGDLSAIVNSIFIVSNEPVGSGDKYSAFEINVDENNITYPPNYEGEIIQNTGGGGSDEYDPNPNSCNTLDVGCWISSAFDRVVDSLQSFWDGFVTIIEGIMQFIANIFVPSDDNLLIGFFDQILDSLNNKLGLFLYPFEFLAEWFDSMFVYGGFNIINCQSGSASPWFCYYEVENAMFGASFVINIRQTESFVNSLGLYEIVIALGRAVGAILFITLAHRVYMKITNQHEEVE